MTGLQEDDRVSVTRFHLRAAVKRLYELSQDSWAYDLERSIREIVLTEGKENKNVGRPD